MGWEAGTGAFLVKAFGVNGALEGNRWVDEKNPTGDVTAN